MKLRAISKKIIVAALFALSVFAFVPPDVAKACSAAECGGGGELCCTRDHPDGTRDSYFMKCTVCFE
jgi:hypothetical protein